MSLSALANKTHLAALLWRQGVCEALQLQRCVVFFVLDGSGKVLALTAKCFVTNGLIYLGSIAIHHHVTSKAVQWLLRTYTEPVYGSATVAAWQHVLGWVFHLLWLLPLYGISLMVSCVWYQQIAVAAFEVQQSIQQQRQLLQQAQHEAISPAAAAAAAAAAAPPQPSVKDQQNLRLQQTSTSHLATDEPLAMTAPLPAPSATAMPVASSGMMQVLEGTAQELFRVLLFLVLTVEVYIVSLLPFVGAVLNVLLLSWLYAYYCFDYKWSLQGTRLPLRLMFFETNWAFFAGFGAPCVIATVFFPFHIGAALVNMLFPVFVLVACGCDPVAAQGCIISAERPSLGSVPVFKLALRPTYWIISRVFGGRHSRHKSRRQ